MNTQHTPAPWSLGSNGASTKVVDADGKAVCMVTYRKDHWNGDLLAAAPDLLAAAQCALADFEGILPEFDPEREHPAWETLAELRAAITKATGETA